MRTRVQSLPGPAIDVGAFAIHAIASGCFAIFTAAVMDPEGRGLLVIVTTLQPMLIVLGAGGVNVTTRHALATSDSAGTRRTAHRSSWRVVAAQLPLTVALAWPVIALSIGQLPLVTASLLVGFAATGAAALLRREILHGIGRHRNGLALEAGTSVTILVAGVAVWSLLGLSVNTVLIIMITAHVGQFLLGIALERRVPVTSSKIVDVGPKASALLGQLSAMAAVRSERLVLAALGPETSVAVYALAAASIEMVSVVPLALSYRIMRVTARSGTAVSTRHLRMAVLLAVALLAMMAFFAIRVLTGSGLLPGIFVEANDAMPYLAISAVPLAMALGQTAILNGLGLFSRAAAVSVVGAGVVIAISFLLVPGQGLVGTAVATLVGYASMAATGSIIIRRSHARSDNKEMT